MQLRDYQETQFQEIRQAIGSGKRRIFVQAATGSGKTALFSQITSNAFTNGHLVWEIVPRNILLDQASKHLTKWGVTHNLISAGRNESLLYNVHVVSLQTLQRRFDKIKRFPKIIIFDEAHINFDTQMHIKSIMPDDTILIGFSATPERTDTRGLSGIYETCIYGKSIPWLTENGYLAPLRYFAPHVDGINDLKRVGTEFDSHELEEFLEKKKIYGDAIHFYKLHGLGRPALGFFRSVKSAYDAAEKFRAEGFNFQTIEGSMSKKEISEKIKLLTSGEIKGLCTCDLATYGVDIPCVSYGFSCRPTLSKALYFQIVGRILRPFPGKTDAIFFDHANLIQDHQDERYPGVPLFYVPDVQWNFNGTEKRKIVKADILPKLCKNCLMYFEGSTCPNCGTVREIINNRPDMNTVDANMIDKTPIAPLRLAERDPEERKEIEKNIDLLVALKDVKGLLNIAADCGYSAMWAYHKLCSGIDVELLHEIKRNMGYKNGWVWFTKKQLERGA